MAKILFSTYNGLIWLVCRSNNWLYKADPKKKVVEVPLKQW